jgi:predicted GH43/DUF377 family glycosyl hydrolase
MMFVGVIGENGPTNVLFARINEDSLTVDDVFFPKLPGRKLWEKNWQMFDRKGICHAIYSIAPWKVLRIEGNHAEFVHEEQCRMNWSGGRLCGGAAPVLHNGAYYSFFHGSTERNGRRLYNTGCIVFAPNPPFSILRYTPDPIDVADPTTCPHDQYADVLFCGGAVRVGNVWCLAHGIHDRWSELRFYPVDEIERQLVNH